jgi:hypothetical protein
MHVGGLPAWWDAQCLGMTFGCGKCHRVRVWGVVQQMHTQLCVPVRVKGDWLVVQQAAAVQASLCQQQQERAA